MSRPFSYNDENFTVIGNICFIHIKVTSTIEAGGVLTAIPPAISERLIQRTCYSFYQMGENGMKGGTWDLRIDNNNNIFTNERISSDELLTYFICILILKDI